MNKYPKIDNNEFGKKITEKFKKYKINEKKSYDEICYPKKFKLQKTQKLLGEYINPKTPYKNLLVYHKIGSGKTCTAITIAESWKKKRKIVVVVPASLIGNFRDELRSQCADEDYITNKERKELKTLEPENKKYKEIIERTDKRIDKNYEIYSYNKFIDDVNKISLKNKVLIIDEIQNLISTKGIYYKKLQKKIDNAPNDLRIVLLSATPIFDKPIELALLINLLRPKEKIETGDKFLEKYIDCKKKGKKIICDAKNLDILKERMKGRISYFKGAPDYVFPNYKIKYVKVNMKKFQYKSYKTVIQKEKKKSGIDMNNGRVFKEGQIKSLPNNFFIGSRIISNIAFPNKDVGSKGYESLTGKKMDIENLEKYSIKFYKIMIKIKNSQGKLYVYSNFKEYGGIRTFQKILEHHGYKNYMKHGKGYKRYAVWSGDVKKNDRETIKNIYNDDDNISGNKLKILLLTPSAKEGISLKEVRQIHILEPYWNMSRLKQIIGRGVRYCSHKRLEEKKRNVKVYIYISTIDNYEDDISVDQYIKNLSIQKQRLIGQFELAMKQAAFDCKLLKKANDENNEYECEYK